MEYYCGSRKGRKTSLSPNKPDLDLKNLSFLGFLISVDDKYPA